jgi:hypothetical protein
MTMHPFVTGRPSRIILLERLIDYMRSFEGVWFTTLEEMAYCLKGSHGETFRYPSQVVGRRWTFHARSWWSASGCPTTATTRPTSASGWSSSMATSGAAARVRGLRAA